MALSLLHNEAEAEDAAQEAFIKKQAVLAAKRAIVTVEEMVDDFGARQPECRDPAVLDHERDRCGARRRASLLCA